MPTWWEGVLLALFAFRLTRLVGWDDLTIKPRRWVTGMGDEEHHQWAHVVEQLAEDGQDAWADDWSGVKPDGRGWDRWRMRLRGDMPPLVSDAVMGHYASTPPVGPARFYVSKLIHCPWCAGWWISLAVAAGWWLWPWGTIRAALPFALSALVGLVAKNLDP